MNEQTESKIPESYWKTSAGEKIAQAMHTAGWDANDCFNTVISALDDGIEYGACHKINAEIVAELVKARDLMAKVKKTYWQVSGILRDECF